MSISPEIRAAQEAYAARPFAVSLRDDCASLTNRFDTEHEAVAYVAEQSGRISRIARSGSWNGRSIWRGTLTCQLTGPHGSREWDLADCLDLPRRAF